MGGWRCSFRNCSVAADGKTHLFHYPVFDKARCLKWLTNAGRLEFLDLKLSQLKNRAICQHHFNDECFMNYKKDKLTFAAVPTRNGSVNDSIDQIDKKTICLPVKFEDIEHFETRPLSTREKKANYSIKYADFLTDPIIYSADNIPDEAYCKKEIEKDEFFSFQMYSHKTAPESSKMTASDSVSQPLLNSKNIDSKGICFHVELDPTQDVLNLLETTPNFVNNSIKQQSDDIIISPQINRIDNTDQLFNNLNITECPENNILIKSKNKIKIISEKTLTMPLPVTGTFKPVCPTGILNPRKRKVETENKNKENTFSSIVKEEPTLPEIKTSGNPVEHKSPTKPKLLEPKNNSKTISLTNKIENKNMISSDPKSPTTRNKVPPERIAAIEEKRLFNKKLRDMIEFCLDDKEENTKTSNTMPTKNLQSEKDSMKTPQMKNKPLDNQPEKCTTKSPSENVKRRLEHKQELESTVNEKEVIKSSGSNAVLPDYKLSVLEAKLSRMENLLLKKVGENTQRIDHLKQTLCKPNDVKKRSIQTQTTQNTQDHKKQLFHEISKYLSTDLNSLIYEELFMKEFIPTATKNASKKKVGLTPTKRQRR